MNYKKILLNTNTNSNQKESSDESFLVIPSKIFNTLIENNKNNSIKSNSIFDISLKNFAKQSIKNFKDIMNELIILFSSQNVIIEDEHFISEGKGFFFKLINIFTKETRLIYNGFFLLLIAFFIYFIDITSK